MLGEHSSSRHRVPNAPERQQLQEGKMLEPREREECHLLQHPHSAASEPAERETSCFVVGNIKEREKRSGEGGVGRSNLKKGIC